MINKVFLEGRLCKDYELFEYKSGKRKIWFTLAVERKYKTETQRADYLDCETWRENIINYFQKCGVKKGDLIMITSGSLFRYQAKQADGKYYDRTFVDVQEVEIIKKAAAKGERPLEEMGAEVNAGEGLGDW